MAKPPTRQDPDSLPRDWFLAAIECNGSVNDSLGAVLAELASRAAFVEAVKLNLEGDGLTRNDAVTDLGIRIRALENTLRFRLGILRPERPAAWFRAPAATSTGPFQSTLLEEPVFAAYDPCDVDEVREALATAWREHQPEAAGLHDQSGCLWATLLAINAQLEHVAVLPPPFLGLRLDMLPDGLPLALESRALRAFLLNVRAEMAQVRERLVACHDQLLATSQKLWAAQLEALQRGAPPAGVNGRARSHAADDLREEFKRRRAASPARAFLTPADLDALKFMGFDDLPAADALRQRYLAMAKRLHPDRQGGNDQAFKLLTGAYTRLASRTEQSKS